MSDEALYALLESVIQIAVQAGEAIVNVVAAATPLDVHKKLDHSPVTLADLRAHDVIMMGLAQLTPTIPVISEESHPQSLTERLSWSRCWLVDPLDGTRGFIEGSSEYTVNIALIEDHRPIMGVIYSPHDKKLYYALQGHGAYLREQGLPRRIYFRRVESERPLNIAVSQYHSAKWLSALLAVIEKYKLVQMNSSVKICLVAEGVADIYPRLGPTSEWDTAAGQCIVEEAGGAIVDLAGQALTYNARHSLENPGFIVVGDQTKKAYFLDLINSIVRSR